MDGCTEEDAKFIRGVVDFMHDDFQAVEKNVEKRIEEYLRQRVLALNVEAQKEVETLQNQHNDEIRKQKEIVKALELRCHQLLGKRKDFSKILHQLRPQAVAVKHFEKWKTWAIRHAEHRRLSDILFLSNQRVSMRQCWGAWRLFCAVRVLRKRQEVLMRSRERQLVAETAALKSQLEKAAKRQKEADEQTKTAFVRGVSALNREALQVLRGETGENDAETIASILRGESLLAPSSPSFLNPMMDARSVYSSPKKMFSPCYYDPRAVAGDKRGDQMEGSHKMIPRSKKAADEHQKEMNRIPEFFFRAQKHGDWVHSGNIISPLELTNPDLVKTPSDAHGNKTTSMKPNPPSADRDSISKTRQSRSDEETGHNATICPVHHTDIEGNFYHKCYAKDSTSRPVRNEVKPTHTPFILRVDPSLGVPLGLPAERKRKS